MGQVIVRSVLDRTLRVLFRAVMVAAPAGLLLWILGTVTVEGQNLLWYLTNFLDPLGRLLGMSGVVLAAFLLGLPANEIVLPIVVLAVTGTFQLDAGGTELASALLLAGFNWEMALCTAVFFLFHWPLCDHLPDDPAGDRQYTMDALFHSAAHSGRNGTVHGNPPGLQSAALRELRKKGWNGLFPYEPACQCKKMPPRSQVSAI